MTEGELRLMAQHIPETQITHAQDLGAVAKRAQIPKIVEVGDKVWRSKVQGSYRV